MFFLHLSCYCRVWTTQNQLQRINPWRLGDVIWCHGVWSALVQVMAWHLFGAKPLPEPVLTCCRLDPVEINCMEIWMKYTSYLSRKCIKKNVVCKLVAMFFFGIIQYVKCFCIVLLLDVLFVFVEFFVFVIKLESYDLLPSMTGINVLPLSPCEQVDAITSKVVLRIISYLVFMLEIRLSFLFKLVMIKWLLPLSDLWGWGELSERLVC